MKRLRNWLSEHTSETIVGDSVALFIASAIGGFAGVSLAIEWMAR